MSNVPKNNLPFELGIKRSRMLQAIRDFFFKKGLIEIDVPILSREVSWDLNLDPFSTKFWSGGFRGEATEYFMQTSPELLLKRLLADGYPDLFSLSHVFRNGESGPNHCPEFCMLEWYRKDFSLQEIIEETRLLLDSILGNKQFKIFRYREIFNNVIGLDPFYGDFDALAQVAGEHGLHSADSSSRSEICDFLFTERVENSWPRECIVCIQGFPAWQPSLAEPDPEEKESVKRFEFFYQGLEICNGFLELREVDEHKRRLHRENQRRTTLKKPEIRLDNGFLAALESGLPKCSGNALGVDRLFMAANNLKQMEEAVYFSWNSV